MKAEELVADPWAFGPWCFVIDEVRLFAPPIVARGMQGWWPLRTAKVDGLQALCDRLAGAEVRAGWTLQQPYATAVAEGPKRIENRPQRRGVPPQGVWLALHAGAAPYPDASAIVGEWRLKGMWPDAPVVGDMPLGVVLGVIRVTQCLPYARPAGEHQLAFDLERDEPSEGK